MTRNLLSLLVLMTVPAFCASYPASWNYLDPATNALIGIEWCRVRLSPFAGVLGSELSSDGTFGFPDIGFLEGTTEVVVTSPGTLAVATGQYTLSQLEANARARGMTLASYRGIPILTAAHHDLLAVALFSERTLLFGNRAELVAAIDRALSTEPRTYNDQLARASALSERDDFWVVAASLPDPMMSGFLPIDDLGGGLTGMQGGVSFRGGLHMALDLDADSGDDAAAVVKNLAKLIPELPSIARGIEYTQAENQLQLTLDVNPEELAANLQPAPKGATSAPAPSVQTAKVPSVIRIFGLDDGVKVIPYPVVK